ncbi:MAG: peptidoglycan D,D-transpeptidase FtsI family protein [Burkholderiaceae bacterium]|jgi:cell division protein FtsI (penicillin-binding protein 3)
MTRAVRFANSHLLQSGLPAWRSRLVMGLMFVGFAGLGARALYLQGLSNEFLQKQGAMRTVRNVTLPADRGRILDRNGVIVASSVPARAIWFDGGKDTGGEGREASKISRVQIAALANWLGMPETVVRQKLNTEQRFTYLKRQVDLDAAEKITALKIPGIYTLPEFRRFYPEAETFAHVLGFTNVEDIGQEGIELAQQKALVGRPGERSVVKDRLGRVIEDFRETRPAVNGQDLTLSIDSKVQFLAYSQLKAAVEAHKAKAGAVVVLDAKTGEVLALANLPSYDPNDRSHLTGAQLRNRVLTDTYEPGSTMKPFTVALALDTHRVTPQTMIDTAPGRILIGPNTISDAHPHGTLTVEQIIQKSSNVGTTKLALGIPPQNMWNMFMALGFGQAPQVDFPGAVAGRVRPWRKWRPIEQATMSYGHGISVSLMQIARAYTIFANDGQLLPLTFMRLDEPPKGVSVVKPATAQAMRKMLEMAAGPEGTAPKAQVPGYRVAGKTGTAHKQEGGRYINRYISSFVGLAPVSDPKLIVAVMLDEPSTGRYYGGDVAAPVFSSIVQGALRALNVAPDAPFKQVVLPAQTVQESI